MDTYREDVQNADAQCECENDSGDETDLGDLILRVLYFEEVSCAAQHCGGCINDSGDDDSCGCDSR